MPERRRMFGAEITNEAVKMVTEGVYVLGQGGHHRYPRHRGQRRSASRMVSSRPRR